jgi:hypothetical protein
MEVVDFEVDEEGTGAATASTASAGAGAGASAKASSGPLSVATARDDNTGGRGTKKGGKVKTKGRGHENADDNDRYDTRGGTYETLDDGEADGSVKC